MGVSVYGHYSGKLVTAGTPVKIGRISLLLPYADHNRHKL